MNHTEYTLTKTMICIAFDAKLVGANDRYSKGNIKTSPQALHDFAKLKLADGERIQHSCGEHEFNTAFLQMDLAEKLTNGYTIR